MRTAEVCLNGKEYITVNANCVDYIYEDEMPLFVTICDELAELTQLSELKTAEAKEQNALKGEIMGIIQSLAQLGRSSGVLVLVATQKPNATIVPTVLRPI